MVQLTEEGKQGTCVGSVSSPHPNVSDVIPLTCPPYTPTAVPIGNGGVTDRYYWTQSLQEATVRLHFVSALASTSAWCLIDDFPIQFMNHKVYVDVPSDKISAKDVKCKWSADSIDLSVRGG